MSKANRRTKSRRKASAPAVDGGAVFAQLMKGRLMQPDPRSHAEFLPDMRAGQAAGCLANLACGW